MPPHLKYAADSRPGNKAGLHYTAFENTHYAWRPRNRKATGNAWPVQPTNLFRSRARMYTARRQGCTRLGFCDLKGANMTDGPDNASAEQYERRAPGWVIRCKRCGFTEPWGKYGIRLGAAAWGKCTLGRCTRCGRICCHAIEKRKAEK